MASSVALRRAAASSALFSKLVNPARSVTISPSVVITRAFNTDSEMTRYDDDRAVEVDSRGSGRSVSRRQDPSLFADVFDPFSPTRSLSQVLNLMDRFVDSPLLGMGSGARRGWDVKEDNDALYLKMDMPGLSKEDVNVSVEESTLIIKGEGKKESEEDEAGRKYSSRLDLPPSLYKLGEIKAEMKNGVLKVNIPKIKSEERKDVFNVNVD